VSETNIVKLMSKTPAAILLFNAIVADSEKDFMEKFNITPEGNETAVTVDVKLTINGVLLPIEKSFSDAIQLIMDAYESQVREEAIHLITNSDLCELYSAIQSAEWIVREAISKTALRD
jgi:hypothetical protein